MQHGTRSSYTAGCRCDACTRAAADQERHRRQYKRLMGNPWHGRWTENADFRREVRACIAAGALDERPGR